MPQAPNSELTSVGIGRESSYGSAATPSVFLISSNTNFGVTNELLDRTAPRKRVGRTKALAGLVVGKGALSVEADPDTLGALLNMSIGAEAVAANANNPGASAVNTTSTAATPIGFTGMPLASFTNVAVGQSLTVDTSGNQETVVVKAVNSTASTFYAYFTKAHGSGVTVVNAAVVLAYDHTFTLASPRGSFTTQINQVTDAKNCVGSKISQISFKANPKSILEAVVSASYQTEAKVGSPTTPVYSVLDAFRFETTGNVAQINGANSDATVLGWGVDVKTGLVSDFPNFGNGRLMGVLPETLSVVSGNLDLAFETETLLQNFWGQPGATGPQSSLFPITLLFKFVSSDYINTAVQYTLQFVLNNVLLKTDGIVIKSNDYLKQNATFECYESINGANDDVKCILTNTASGNSI